MLQCAIHLPLDFVLFSLFFKQVLPSDMLPVLQHKDVETMWKLELLFNLRCPWNFRLNGFYAAFTLQTKLILIFFFNIVHTQQSLIPAFAPLRLGV